MKKIFSFFNLTRFERNLWLCSSIVVIISSFFSGNNSIIYTFASFIGVTALIFVSKGDVIGQILCVIFGTFYGIFSISYGYYGEAVTYMLMTVPMAILATVSWLKNPYKKREVKIASLSKKEILIMVFWAVIVTIVFYFVLKALSTKNLVISTFSITTSFFASYLTFKRSPYYALAYAVNDIVLIILWIFASITDIKYLSMVSCFAMFFFNDLYGFVNWRRMRLKQEKGVK